MPEYFLVSRNAGEKWLRLAKAGDVGDRSARDAASPNSRSARGVKLREPFYSKTEPSRTGQRANGSDQSAREVVPCGYQPRPIVCALRGIPRGRKSRRH